MLALLGGCLFTFFKGDLFTFFKGGLFTLFKGGLSTLLGRGGLFARSCACLAVQQQRAALAASVSRAAHVVIVGCRPTGEAASHDRT